MGSRGALVIGLRHPNRYRSLSAFAPIVAPSQVPWGQKALVGYLGNDRAGGVRRHRAGRPDRWRRPILIDQGDADPFLQEQLRPHLFTAAAGMMPVTLRMPPGYDHSYFFIATFIGDHIAYHAAALNA